MKSHQADWQRLTDIALQEAEASLKAHGAFPAFALALKPDNSVERIDVQPTQDEIDTPELLEETLIAASKASAADGARACAVVFDTRYTHQGAEGDAIRLHLEHADEAAPLQVYQPYAVSDGEVRVAGEVFSFTARARIYDAD